MIEIATGLTFLVSYMNFDLSPMSIVFCYIGLVLIIMIVTDLEHYIIPLQLQFALIPGLLAYRLFQETNLTSSMFEMFFGILTGLSLGLGLMLGYKFIRNKEGLGGADVIFLAIAGGFLNLKIFPVFLFLSGLFGIITHFIWQALKFGKIFPFGPALAISLYVCLYQSNNIEVFLGFR